MVWRASWRRAPDWDRWEQVASSPGRWWWRVTNGINFCSSCRRTFATRCKPFRRFLKFTQQIIDESYVDQNTLVKIFPNVLIKFNLSLRGLKISDKLIKYERPKLGLDKHFFYWSGNFFRLFFYVLLCYIGIYCQHRVRRYLRNNTRSRGRVS